jgi:hypothetical protein
MRIIASITEASTAKIKLPGNRGQQRESHEQPGTIHH